jgi:hypothetical protein
LAVGQDQTPSGRFICENAAIGSIFYQTVNFLIREKRRI